jgi:cytochrome c biogenesis protein CcmG/thiol:disulfide interchange protein DsbE
MSTRMQWIVVAIVVSLLGGGAIAATRVLQGSVGAVAIGAPAPDFRAVTVDSQPRVRTLADYKGDVVLLNIWATWCGPCRVEMPSMEALHKDFASQGLRVVAVSIDQIAGPPEIRDFARELGLTFEILHDSAQTIVRSYQVNGYPQSFVIGRDGTIRRKWIGAENWNSPANRSLMRALLAPSGQPAAARGS